MGPEAHFFDWGMFWQAASAIATTAAVIVALWQTKYVNKKRVKLIYGEQFRYSRKIQENRETYHYNRYCEYGQSKNCCSTVGCRTTGWI